MSEGPALASCVQLLAITRPSMKLGVPVEAFYANLVGVCYFTMIVGRGNPLYYLLMVPIHIGFVVLSNRNPNFFWEWRMWFFTFAQLVSRVLMAGGSGKRVRSSV